MELDIDEPSIEALQALMILAQANFQLGKGKKSFMLLSMSNVSGAVIWPLADFQSQLLRLAWRLPSIYTVSCPLQ